MLLRFIKNFFFWVVGIERKNNYYLEKTLFFFNFALKPLKPYAILMYNNSLDYKIIFLEVEEEYKQNSFF